VQASVDELAEAERDVVAAARERVGERLRDDGRAASMMRTLRSSASRRRSSPSGSSRAASWSAMKRSEASSPDPAARCAPAQSQKRASSVSSHVAPRQRP
jgi:hypothetical protein